jgi:glycosyltransferase involved in cell wall biosynthesis
MKIGIHITTYNRPIFTDQCLKSFYWSNPKDIDLIIIDNKSEIETINILKKYEKEKSSRVIYNDKNMGLGFAINQGWEILSKTCDILACINNDFLFEPSWDENIRSCFSELQPDYIIGTVHSDKSRIIQTTKNGKGKYTTKHDIGAAYFITKKLFKDGIRMPSKQFTKNYVGPGPEWHKLLESKKFKGIRLSNPGILVRDSEYSNKENIQYYDETFGVRNLKKKLNQFRELESKGGRRGIINWEEFLQNYYNGEEK